MRFIGCVINKCGMPQCEFCADNGTTVDITGIKDIDVLDYIIREKGCHHIVVHVYNGMINKLLATLYLMEASRAAYSSKIHITVAWHEEYVGDGMNTSYEELFAFKGNDFFSVMWYEKVPHDPWALHIYDTSLRTVRQMVGRVVPFIAKGIEPHLPSLLTHAQNEMMDIVRPSDTVRKACLDTWQGLGLISADFSDMADINSIRCVCPVAVHVRGGWGPGYEFRPRVSKNDVRKRVQEAVSNTGTGVVFVCSDRIREAECVCDGIPGVTHVVVNAVPTVKFTVPGGKVVERSPLVSACVDFWTCVLSDQFIETPNSTFSTFIMALRPIANTAWCMPVGDVKCT